MAKVQWGDKSFSDDVNEKLDYFNSEFLSVLERHTPIKQLR
jgi:hypothetical protein